MSSYTPYQWTNRNSEHPYRRTLTNVNDTTDVKTVDVTRAEGRIDAQGDSFDANTMNAMEGRIASAFSTVDQAMGNLNNLTTQDKSSLVGAINEVAAGGGGGGSSTLAGLTDTSISSPTNGQVLKYNSTSSKWENAAESGGGSGAHKLTFKVNTNAPIFTGVATYTFDEIVDETGTIVAGTDAIDLLSDGYDGEIKFTNTDYDDDVYVIGMAGFRSDVSGGSYLGTVFFNINANNGSIGSTSSYNTSMWQLYISTSGSVTVIANEEGSNAEAVPYRNNTSGLSATSVQDAIDEMASEKADIASPAFTGSPTAPTPSAGDDSTKIATTAFVQTSHEYQKGETISIAGMLCPFWQTATSLRIFIPLTKIVNSGVSTSSITQTGNFEIRSYNGTAIASGHPLSDYGTVTFYRLAGGIGVLVSNLNSTWGDTSRYTTGFAYANSGNTIQLGSAS